MTRTPARPADRREPAALVQSVDRAVSVLEILARRGVAGVTELAQELGVHKSTASRLVAVLERRGLVEQLADRGKYRLGFGLLRLAGALDVQRDLVDESRRACRSLAAEVGETVNVAILSGGRVVNISQVRGPAAVSVHNWVGQATPAHATSSGKVLLAFLPPDPAAPDPAAPDPAAPGATAPDRAAAAAPGGLLEPYTEHTVRDPAALAAQLADVRARGWATTVEEYELGLNAVAAPVRDHEGSVVAAVSVSGPSYRLSPEALERVAPRVVQAAQELSRRLGHSGGPVAGR